MAIDAPTDSAVNAKINILMTVPTEPVAATPVSEQPLRTVVLTVLMRLLKTVSNSIGSARRSTWSLSFPAA